MKLSRDHAALMHVLDAKVVQFVFELGGKLGPLLGLLHKEEPRWLILDVVTNFEEAFVAVSQYINELFERSRHFFVVNGFSHNVLPSTRMLVAADVRLA
jgi:hypothetical protein